MASAPLRLSPSPIKFGTDGWRGVLGVDITVERLLPVAAAAAQELAHRAPDGLNSRTVIIGFDRRFLAPELAEAIANACLLYTSPSPRDLSTSRMPSSA